MDKLLEIEVREEGRFRVWLVAGDSAGWTVRARWTGGPTDCHEFIVEGLRTLDQARREARWLWWSMLNVSPHWDEANQAWHGGEPPEEPGEVGNA